MSYKKLESGYLDLRIGRPSFYIGDDSRNKEEMDEYMIPDENLSLRVYVGICAMEKKSRSKAMKEILTRLEEFEYIKIIIFNEDMILNDPVEKWPICECLISFHSRGFPLDKAVAYAKLRNPFIINDLDMQYDMLDRRKVHEILLKEGIQQPCFAVLDRDSQNPDQLELIEGEDHIEVNGIIFNKPFVEKPISAEDHNIYIYYPTCAGGGSQRLFRKIGSRSSVYSPSSQVRKTGSYVYEDFMPTDGTDVKVYTVGPDYAHAEARKSPALDGKVERDSEGKEVRYPVILNNTEKLIARKVCLAFKQTVCGFDLLRANGKSYVCDVNGFSFVKNSMKYYDDCAKILGNMIMRELSPLLHIPWSIPFQLDDPPIVPTTIGKMMELRCVVGIMRHGDRTPKQKMKMEVKHPKFFDIFEKYNGFKSKAIKLKKPKQLQEILDVARYLLNEIRHKTDPEIQEKQAKLKQLKNVLEMYGHFSGINRKVQLKYQPKGRPKCSSSEDDVPREPSLILILKWGGELTPTGRIQAEELGRVFRCMYPGGQGDYAGNKGLGLMRLHSTYRHDLKIYASDEGRVQMTAAAFAKGLLSLEGELTPILVQMVKSAYTNGLLDNDCESFNYQASSKRRLHLMMQKDQDFTEEDYRTLNPTDAKSINNAMQFLKNPVTACDKVHHLIKSLIAFIEEKQDESFHADYRLVSKDTNLELMRSRWVKLEKDFQTKTGKYDISKIPDIYDCIKYDVQHNQVVLQFDHNEELYFYAKALADIVIPQEYGISKEEKLVIGQGICLPLLKKIRADLNSNVYEAETNECESVNRLNPRYSHGVCSPERHVRTRLYFTSESHIHSLLTILRYGSLLDTLSDDQWFRAMEFISAVSELNYLTQIVIMLYEDPTKELTSENRFHVELHFSPGVSCIQKNLPPPGPGFRPKSQNGPEKYGSIEYLKSKDLSHNEETEDDTLYEEKESPSVFDECPSIIEENITEKSNEIDLGVDALQSEISSANNIKSNPIPINKVLNKTEYHQQVHSEPNKRLQRSFSTSDQRPLSLDENMDLESTKLDRSTLSLDNFTDDDSETLRRQRHSIPALVNDYIRLYSMEYQKSAGSSTSLFSTAIISGSTSAPELKQENRTPGPLTAGNYPGVPGIRPLETLHNALSLKQMDEFLSRMTEENFRTPLSSPHKLPSLSSNQQKYPCPLSIASPTSSAMYSGPPSFVSSSGPSSPNSTALDILSRLNQVSEQDISSSFYGDFNYPNTMSSSQTSSHITPNYSATPSPPESFKR